MTERELAVRRAILAGFAETGEAPAVQDAEALRSLAEQRVVVLGEGGEIVMAHPFAAPRGGARVEAGGRTWWGSCAWDGLGIVAALGLREAAVTSTGVTLRVRDGVVAGTALFHVAVPASHWWDDIAFT